MRAKALIRLTFLGSFIAWVVLVFSDVTVLFSDIRGLRPDVPVWLPRVMFDLYVLCLFYYYKFKIEKEENLNFTDILWQVFATGLVATVISLALRLILFLLGETALATNVLFVDVVYQINLALFISFLIAAYTSWKRLILYQKSKWLIRIWRVFEFTLLFALLYDSINTSLNGTLGTVIAVALGVVGLILSANMKWVAYLNFKQKWTSLLLLLLAFFYLGYFLYTVTRLSDFISIQSTSFLDFRAHTFSLSIFGFVIVYSLFSFLVILFNLPTSSVFEQKLEEVVNFQRISQSIQTEQNEESVYNILLESSVSSVFADAAWLEIKSASEEDKLYTYGISEPEARAIKDHLSTNKVKGVLDQGVDKTKNLSKHLGSLKGARFRSILSFPIMVKGDSIGTLAILKELPEGFNKEMTRVVSTFANQAGISIENFRLLEEAFQNERYKEELKIAKMVQKSLLPENLESDGDFDIAAFSQSADEVGGDYYDTIRVNENKVALIIADVSGKGTTAAFHMSQMKGIFHSLAQQELEPTEFMVRANQALVFCLERGSFISAIYFVIDTVNKTVTYCRAGHCPVLYYHGDTDSSEYFKDKGAALGMVKNKSYCKMIEVNSFGYKTGDIMVLYTDGITEANDNKGEEFGYDRLQQTLMEVRKKSAKEIQEHLITKLYEYSGTKDINDDYTTMIVKFG
ncbi:MAG TPA: SpoIIE family protein phosphatase [Cyclobacteriaceae bacterium]|nr:SpoIIE family protein phosphatase [Cyclobacteriaceae bacterium]